MSRFNRHIPFIIFCYISFTSAFTQAIQDHSASKFPAFRYPSQEGVTLIKTFKGFMICDTSGQLKKPSEVVFDGSILFECGQWNSTGLPLIFRQWNCAYISKKGDTIASSRINDFTNAYPYNNGYALVQKGNKYNFIDRRCKIIGDQWLDYAEDFSEGLAIAGIGRWDKGKYTGKLGFIDTTLKLAIPMVFESAENFSKGIAKVWLRGKMFQIDHSGKPVRADGDRSAMERGMNILGSTSSKSFINPEEKDPAISIFTSHVDTESLPISTGNGWDFKKRDGSVALHVNYDYVLKFSEGLAPVKKKNQWNFIDEKGNLLLSDWLEDAENFKFGIAKVRKNSKTGFISHDGQYIIPLMYPVKYFSGGRACIEMAGEKGKELTYIDKTGNPLISWMAGTTQFINGQAEIKREDGMLATIDMSGNIIEGWHYHVLFSGDNVEVLECNNKYTLREKKNNKLIYDWIPDVALFSEGRLALKKNNMWGFVDKYGKVLIKFDYDECWNFEYGLALVKKNKKYTWIDKNGKNISKDWFDGVGTFGQDLVAVKKRSRWGYMSSKGEIVIKPQYEAAAPFSEGFALVRKGGKFGYISKKGKKLTGFDFTAGGNFTSGQAIVKKGKVSGVVDMSGNFTVK